MKNKYKVLIISCWAIFLIATAFKMFGANLFIAGSNNETFIRVCNYIQNSIIYYIIGTLFNIVGTTFYLMAVLEEKKPKLLWFIPLVLYTIVKTIFNKYDVLFFILDISVIMIGLPLLINYKMWLKISIGVVLNIVFQLLSQFLKLGQYGTFDNNVVIAVILSIDYYIMLVLFYLYSNYVFIKKGDK